MNKSSSGFGDESPILFRPSSDEISDVTPNFGLEELHKELLLHLKRSKNIERQELKMYLENVTQMNPTDHKNRWLVMKIKGLLNYILKKRAAFQKSISSGEITIYEKFVPPPAPPSIRWNSSATADIPLSMLSNNDFVSTDLNNLNQMEVENNYSQDLFSDTIENLHSFAKQNYDLLKGLTQNTPAYIEGDDNKVFKMPLAINKIEKAHKMHEELEDGYNSILSIPIKASQTFAEEIPRIKCELVTEFGDNIFDNGTDTSQELSTEFDKEFELLENWVSAITFNLRNLEFNEVSSSQIHPQKEEILNVSTESTGSTRIQTFYSEENLKIIRETCSKFRKNLEKKKSFEVLHLFDFSQSDFKLP